MDLVPRAQGLQFDPLWKLLKLEDIFGHYFGGNSASISVEPFHLEVILLLQIFTVEGWLMLE